MAVWIGTSGWQYRDWRGAFYPRKLPQRQWLRYHGERFRTVEINATFYRLPPPERFSAWAAETPDDYVLCPKVSQYLSHYKRLRDPAEPVGRFMEGAGRLGGKLGPALLQLPPHFAAEPARLDATLGEFPDGVQVAVEFRDPSWWTDETQAVLEDRGAAYVWPDRKSRLLGPRWRTADWGYVRFHEGAGVWPCYGKTALESRAALVAETYGDADIWVFFNNDPRCCAVRDARWFAAACRRHGLTVTRVPKASEVTLQPPS